jgi:hypothetical protein
MSNKSELFSELIDSVLVAKRKDSPEAQAHAARFVGYGNPEADILLIANDTDFFYRTELELLPLKSANPDQWKQYLANPDPNAPLADAPKGFFNPTRPTVKLPFNRGDGKALNSFQRAFFHAGLTEKFDGDLTFLEHAFIVDFSVSSERNSASKIIQIPNARKELLAHPYFKQFKLVLLAIGRELMDDDASWLKLNFDLDQKDDWDMHEPDLTTFKQTLFVYSGKNRYAGKTVMHTRKMSGGSSNDFFMQLGKVIAETLAK